MRLLRFQRVARVARGYSLIDVLAGFVILSITLSSAYSLAIHNARLMERNQNYGAASLLAQYKVEELRNLAYDNILSGEDAQTINAQGGNGGIFTRTWDVEDDTPSVDMKTITVTITWDQWGDDYSYTMHGVVAK